jgi:hypothetical protein
LRRKVEAQEMVAGARSGWMQEVEETLKWVTGERVRVEQARREVQQIKRELGDWREAERRWEKRVITVENENVECRKRMDEVEKKNIECRRRVEEVQEECRKWKEKARGQKEAVGVGQEGDGLQKVCRLIVEGLGGMGIRYGEEPVDGKKGVGERQEGGKEEGKNGGFEGQKKVMQEQRQQRVDSMHNGEPRQKQQPSSLSSPPLSPTSSSERNQKVGQSGRRVGGQRKIGQGGGVGHGNGNGRSSLPLSPSQQQQSGSRVGEHGNRIRRWANCPDWGRCKRERCPYVYHESRGQGRSEVHRSWGKGSAGGRNAGFQRQSQRYQSRRGDEWISSGGGGGGYEQKNWPPFFWGRRNR